MQHLQRKPVFLPEQLGELNPAQVPKHVAIIPDGNRRWARKSDLDLEKGHQRGAQMLRDIVQAASELGIEVVTLYSFSTENWRRSPEEVECLMELLKVNLIQCREELQEFGVRLEVIGDLTGLPPEILPLIEQAKTIGRDNDKITLVLAINYGSRDEIRRAVVKIAGKVAEGAISPDAITEQTIAGHLDTAPWGDPELFIRTSGEMRVSNFLLWQICYSEIYVTDVLWPDFTPGHLLKAVQVYQHRQRRLGK